MDQEFKSGGIRVLIAAGGTGGHLMPAIFIARQLQSLSPDCRIRFVGSGRYLESELIDPLFYRYEINSSGLAGKGLAGILTFLRSVPLSIRQTYRILKEYSPDIIVGMGGYISFWPVFLASILRVPTWIHEAERSAGLSNRALAYLASGISTAFPDTKIAGGKRKIYSGHPVRESLLNVKPLIPSENPRHLLLLGGSQGSLSLDEAMLGLTDFLKEGGFEIWHQCRKENVDSLERHYRNHEIPSRVNSFIKNMEEAYDWAEIIISRSGAGAIAEIEAVNRPAILVPYPFSQGGHQKENAMYLVSRGKALLVEEGDNFRNKLLEALVEISNAKTFKKMHSSPHKPRSLTAAQDIAEKCIELLKR